MSIITLSQPLYNLNIYDRVLSSQSTGTLFSITSITLFIMLCFGGFDWARALIQAQMGRSVDEASRPILMEASIRQSAVGGEVERRLSRLDELKNFVTGGAFASLFDLIFVPVYFSTLFLVHIAVGVVCSICAVLLVVMALVPEWAMKTSLSEYWMHKVRLRREERTLTQNAQELVVLGGVQSGLQRYFANQNLVEGRMIATQDTLDKIRAINRVAMMMIQTLLMAVTTYLVIHRQVQTGALFAVNLIAMRALQPLFQVTSSFKSLNKAMDAWRDISEALAKYKKDERALQPLLNAELRIRKLTVLNRQEDKKVLQHINVDVDPGELVVVTGTSGAGKSTLLKAAVGLLPDYIGNLELDGRELKHWRFDRSTAFIGYLPQEIRLFDATLIDNISLFAENVDQDEIIRLCTEIGLHDDIAALKDGYATMVDSQSPQFSGGQLRLIGLARACYGNPKLLVLDEPTTGLDWEREMQVMKFLAEQQKKNTSIMVSSHSPNVMKIATKILWLKWGQIKAYGMRDEILTKMGLLQAPKVSA